MVLKCTMPEPDETRALMTGVGQYGDAIEAAGRARMARVCRDIPPEQLAVAPPEIKQCHSQTHAPIDLSSALPSAPYQRGTI